MNTFKRIAFSIIFGILFISCNEDNEEVKDKNSLIGTWQLVQAFEYSEAGPGNWNEVEDGYTYKFFHNGDFYSTRFDECTSGTFSTESNLLMLEYSCDGFTAGIEDSAGIFMEDYIFVDGLLFVNPAYPTSVEGFVLKFRKISH